MHKIFWNIWIFQNIPKYFGIFQSGKKIVLYCYTYESWGGCLWHVVNPLYYNCLNPWMYICKQFFLVYGGMPYPTMKSISPPPPHPWIDITTGQNLWLQLIQTSHNLNLHTSSCDVHKYVYKPCMQYNVSNQVIRLCWIICNKNIQILLFISLYEVKFIEPQMDDVMLSR